MSAIFYSFSYNPSHVFLYIVIAYLFFYTVLVPFCTYIFTCVWYYPSNCIVWSCPDHNLPTHINLCMESLVVGGFWTRNPPLLVGRFLASSHMFFPFCNLTSLLYSAKIYFKVPQGNGLRSGNLSPGTTRIFSEFWVSLCTFLRLFSQMSVLFALLPLPTAWNSAHLSIFG